MTTRTSVVTASHAAALVPADAVLLRTELEAAGCRHLNVGHFADSLVERTLGYFVCQDTGIHLVGLPDSPNQLALRLATPQPIALAADAVWGTGQVVDMPEAIARVGVCNGMDDLELLPSGGIAADSGGPFAMHNVGAWRQDGDTLHVTSQWADAGQVIPIADLTQTFTCEGARLWLQDGRRGWLCHDRYMACDSAWIHVVGPDASRSTVGRALASDARFGRRIPVVPDTASAGAALTVAYRPEHAGLAGYVAALLERDLGVIPDMHERSEAAAPVVVGVPEALGER